MGYTYTVWKLAEYLVRILSEHADGKIRIDWIDGRRRQSKIESQYRPASTWKTHVVFIQRCSRSVECGRTRSVRMSGTLPKNMALRSSRFPLEKSQRGFRARASGNPSNGQFYLELNHRSFRSRSQPFENDRLNLRGMFFDCLWRGSLRLNVTYRTVFSFIRC